MAVGKEPRKAMKLDLPTRRGVLRNGGCLLGGALLLPFSSRKLCGVKRIRPRSG
jgi:hypothetical protein